MVCKGPRIIHEWVLVSNWAGPPPGGSVLLKRNDYEIYNKTELVKDYGACGVGVCFLYGHISSDQ